MKRTNVYLTQNQIDKIAKIAEGQSRPAAEVLRDMVDFGLMLYDPAGFLGDIEFVRQQMIAKNGGADVSYQNEFLTLAREKAEEYRSRQHNSARLTTVVERMDEVIATNRELASENRELINLIKGGQADEPPT